MPRWLARTSSLLAGASLVLAFAPFNLWWLAPVPLALLFRLWWCMPKQAITLGWCFGLGLFTVGAHWIYISLHDHGGMPALVAGIALLGFAGFCALIPAAAGLLGRRLDGGNVDRTTLLVLPAAWTLFEWTRTWFCTGFPWLAIGYSQVPDSPLSAWLPLGGVYTASLCAALIAGALANLSLRVLPATGADASTSLGPTSAITRTWPAVGVLAGVAVMTALVTPLQFTHPDGLPVSVALLQGNIPQEDKFNAGHIGAGLRLYRDLADASHARLIVMPESAVPLLRDDVPEGYLDSLAAIARRNGGDLLVGMFDEPLPGEIHNSMFSLGQSPGRVYRKHHLVPFGEFIPLGGLVAPVMDALLKMPIGSQAAGPLGQGVMAVAGQRVAMDICYEDAFGEEIITALPAATLLVNVSNDAWFGMAVGPEQHLQMAQARSLETGRVMLRTTNTGVTALIGPDGRVIDRVRKGVVATLEGQAQGRTGSTPFVRWGNLPLVWLSILMLLAGGWPRLQASLSDLWQRVRNLRES